MASQNNIFSEDEHKDSGMISMLNYTKKKCVRPKKKHQTGNISVTATRDYNPFPPSSNSTIPEPSGKNE